MDNSILNARGRTILRLQGDSLDQSYKDNILSSFLSERILLRGSSDDDIITVAHDRGDVRITVGSGNDRVDSGDGDDQIFGGDGNDVINAGSGNDVIVCGTGDDVCSGDAGDDELFGDEGDDTLCGGAGVDVLKGGAGSDRLEGGAGTDLISGGEGVDIIDGGSGNDHLSGDMGNDWLSGGDGDDLLHGGAGNDMLHGGAGNDTFLFYAADGNDYIATRFPSADPRHPEVDTVRFAQFDANGLDAVNLVPGEDGRHQLTIRYGGSGSLTIYPEHQGDRLSVDQFRFRDGQVLTLAQLQQLYPGEAESADAEEALSGTDFVTALLDFFVGTTAQDEAGLTVEPQVADVMSGALTTGETLALGIYGQSHGDLALGASQLRPQ